MDSEQHEPVTPTPLSEVVLLATLIVVVGLIYGARLGAQPVRGEETRWATGAREMLATGDWVVPRQQGQVFPERPPMTMWMMAMVGYMRGDVDVIAVRLPSVVAIVLTALTIYVYMRHSVSQSAALIGALVFATMGQVLQIGRLGESEALFTLLLSGSLLWWHLGYLRRWPLLVTWTLGFSLAGLAALVKGLQAPVYFVAITVVYLAVRRDWRTLLCWQYVAGAATFFAIVGAWLVPFYLATDWAAVVAIWSGLATDRLYLDGLAQHMVMYPLETFACLLPWSPLLFALTKSETRRVLDDARPVISFVLTALLVTYPTVWLATGARGRYFMPLYPLVAVLNGLLVERCALAPRGSYPRRAWGQFLFLWTTLIAAGGLIVAGQSLLPSDWAAALHQPRWFSIAFALLAAGAVWALWRANKDAGRLTALSAVVTIATIVAIGYVGIIININVARWWDPTETVAQLRRFVPAEETLVSFTPIDHRFAYFYQAPIEQLDWPTRLSDLPPDVDYFCFMRHPGDTAQHRKAGRGRSWTTTPGTLPFAWEEVTTICVERRLRDADQPMVVLGRVVRPLRPVVTDATQPQRKTAQKPAAPPHS
jgi:4-amino-4-deoxy-L-arabinose transferase-like glycosyltransferase